MSKEQKFNLLLISRLNNGAWQHDINIDFL